MYGILFKSPSRNYSLFGRQKDSVFENLGKRTGLTYVTAQQFALYFSPQGILFSLLLASYYIMSLRRLAQKQFPRDWVTSPKSVCVGSYPQPRRAPYLDSALIKQSFKMNAAYKHQHCRRADNCN